MSGTRRDELPEEDAPDAAGKDEPMGTPTSDRHHAERSGVERGGNKGAEKHTYTP